MDVKTVAVTCMVAALLMTLLAFVGSMETEDLVAHGNWMGEARETGEWVMW